MMHQDRRFAVVAYQTPDDLAAALTKTTWTLCAGFYVAGRPDVVFLNDSTGPDGAQEYAVYKLETPFDPVVGIKGGNHEQIESLTVSWSNTLGVVRAITEALKWKPKADDDHTLTLESKTAHGACRWCM